MRALTVIPRQPGSARLEELSEPPLDDGPVLVEPLAIGICGTDAEIVAGDYGWAPPGSERLTLGHESLGRVLEAPDGSGLRKGELVVGIVRRPDPEPCECCARGQFDMCRNGRYSERGIKERDGYASERFRIEPEYAVGIDSSLGELGVLMEPTSILAKAWDQIERIGARACFEPERVLVTGAGPIGLLGALLARQRGLEVHVLDRAERGPKPELVEALGASYHTGSVAEACSEPDVVIEATGAGQVVFDVMQGTAAGGIVCLTGVSPVGRTLGVDPGALNNELVLENDVVFGSVNANRRHYELAAEALSRADRSWLERIITRRVPLERWEEALEQRPDEVKTVVEFVA